MREQSAEGTLIPVSPRSDLLLTELKGGGTPQPLNLPVWKRIQNIKCWKTFPNDCRGPTAAITSTASASAAAEVEPMFVGVCFKFIACEAKALRLFSLRRRDQHPKRPWPAESSEETLQRRSAPHREVPAEQFSPQFEENQISFE